MKAYKIIRYPAQGEVKPEVPFPTTDEYIKMTSEERRELDQHQVTICTTPSEMFARYKLQDIADGPYCTESEWQNDGLVLIAGRADGFKFVFAIIEEIG